MSKRALILGAGQDASYLAELLLEKGYQVHLLHRRSSADNLWRVRHLLDRLTLHKGDLADHMSVENALSVLRPNDELYNAADQDHIDWSLYTPGYSHDITAGAVGRILCSLVGTEVKMFQPLSITMFGDAPPPQDESTPLAPASPYACAKAAAWLLCKHYRREYGLHVSCGIMANHDSPRRQGDYLLHKICRGAVRIAAGLQETLPLSDPEMRVDVGYAPDFVEAAWRILQLDKPDDFVLGTGTNWTIRDMAHVAFRLAGVGDRTEDDDDFDQLIATDPSFTRPGVAPSFQANPTKAVAAGVWRDAGPGPRYVIRDLVAHYQAKLEKEGTL